ncbi:alginate O-acetyltransferase AlgX-related protein [Methylobacterium sp. CM6246]
MTRLEIEHLEQALSPSKTLDSPSGWLFLINDHNSFLYYQYGFNLWTSDQESSARDIMSKRLQVLTDRGIDYIKLIVPEKSIIYSELMPERFSSAPICNFRPAVQLVSQFPDRILYGRRTLDDAKRICPVYFRGDTHTNWIGAWALYRSLMEPLQKTTPSIGPLLSLRDLSSRVAYWDGDLREQMTTEQATAYDEQWCPWLTQWGLEQTILLEIPEQRRLARPVSVPAEYQQAFHRPTYIYETSEQSKPRAVIFRDSTADLMHPFIAEHFSRSVFVWRDGIIYEDVINREDPDIVLHIMAERFVSAYWQSEPIASAGALTGFLKE